MIDPDCIAIDYTNVLRIDWLAIAGTETIASSRIATAYLIAPLPLAERRIGRPWSTEHSEGPYVVRVG
jgi:hypothetical protein